MADPHMLRIRVYSVTGEAIAGARVTVTLKNGATVIDHVAQAIAPLALPLKAAFVQVEVNATAPHYFDEDGELLLNVYDRWAATNGCWKLTEDAGVVTLDVALGRIRYAKVVSLPPTQEVPPDYTPPAIVLDERPQYRAYWPDVAKKMMILRQPARGDLDAAEWNRFAHDPIVIRLADAGNWLFLEYGDPDNDGQNVRFLLGVWAPHSIPLATPAVVIQLTPNPVGYPVDRFPFTGAYPFRMVPEAPLKSPATTVPISKMHQRYADLAIDRSLLTWWAVYQIYGARPDLFSGPNGPIVITVVPAATTRGVQRAPLSHREGIGRMTAEVLRFLWCKRLTITKGVGSLRLLFPSYGTGSVTASGASRPTASPDGYPAQITSTVLTHSAGVAALAELAGPRRGFPQEFSQELWGGCLSYGEKNWQGIWLIDGVARDADGPPLYQPAKGSAIVDTWKSWVRLGESRRFVAVYCEAGLSGSDENGLVTVKRIGGKAGWIEEGQTSDKKIAWLRVSNSLLAQTNPTAFPDATPRLGVRNKPHDDIFTIGIGYAARRPS